MRKLGASPAARRINVIIDEVVVLPWVPATPIATTLCDDRREHLGSAEDRHAPLRRGRALRRCPSGPPS